MEVRIVIDTTQPPTGRVVAVAGGPALPFVGWIQLLTLLAKTIQPPAVGGVIRRSETAP